MNYFVYILSGKDSKPAHIGITNDLIKGVYENLSKKERESGKKGKRLVHYEIYSDPVKAKLRKQQLERELLRNKN